ncbi:MAG: ATP-dependent Clp protease ATP-binding subunit [Candidatus Gracilibacteria bacterium]|nr:ATP-dependent Clp protease ATP-binding subunit [Candidatus Gracilibacteria bacterium]MDD2908228.1 ATP-dependent Clp protease ATP-binding subunit [Candidatus Gracilibacteria bacterium]
MLDNFSTEYKKVLIDAENNVKNNGFKEVIGEDVFLEIIKITEGNINQIFSSYGINEKIVLDVMTQKQFNIFNEKRKGEYIGMSKELKDSIVDSIKIAAGFKKNKASLEDFILALIKNNTSWFMSFLNFIGVNPKDIEISLTSLANNGPKGNGVFDPIDNIIKALEEGLGFPVNPENIENNPFFANKKVEGETKSDTLTPALDFFGVDLTQEARNGKIDKIIGRDKEIERLISVINRKTKNNPCLVGEPGVGKTAIIEGLAKRISEGTVPFAMQNKRIITLDLGGMVAGTKYRGEFETRIKQIIDEASKLENEVILFIDEIHTIIGAGSGEGSLDAANILKPAMGRGKICVIGATTLNEYQKHIEKDSALERRFQKIECDEPTPEVAKEILKGLKESFEDYHNLVIEDEAIDAAVDYSVRFMTDRFLPDKAIDIIDEACSSKSMKYNYNEDGIVELKLEIEKLQKNIDDYVMSQQYHKAMIAKEKQKELEKKIKDKKIKTSIPRNKRLKIKKGDIQKILNQITGIPLENLTIEDLDKLKKLENDIGAKIIGQNEVIKAIVSSIRRSRTGIADKNRPIGSFLLLGPTGVGKTELVKVLAQEFFGDPKALIKVDMSEYSEKASVSKLIGSAPGYVGYEEGGMLTEKVRRKPYSVVLFDELEKGNFEIFNILLQILEEGSLTDSKGRKVNFKNTIIIMTSNIGGEEFNSKAAQIGFDFSDNKEAKIIKDYEKIKEKVMLNLEEYFPPEFLNRIDKTIVFNPLDKKVLKKIIELNLADLASRLKELGHILEYDKKALDLINKETYNPEYGARPIRRYIQEKIEDEIANLLINKKIRDTITLGVEKGKLTIK